MRTCNLSISLEYRREGGEWLEHSITPEQFFWSDPDEPNEVWGIGSTWELNEPIRYLPEEQQDANYVRLLLADKESNSFMKCVYHHWSGVNNYTCLVTEGLAETVTSKELIHVSAMPHLEEGSQCLRIDLTAGEPSVTMNCLMHGKGGDEFTIDLVS